MRRTSASSPIIGVWVFEFVVSFCHEHRQGRAGMGDLEQRLPTDWQWMAQERPRVHGLLEVAIRSVEQATEPHAMRRRSHVSIIRNMSQDLFDARSEAAYFQGNLAMSQRRLRQVLTEVERLRKDAQRTPHIESVSVALMESTSSLRQCRQQLSRATAELDAHRSRETELKLASTALAVKQTLTLRKLRRVEQELESCTAELAELARLRELAVEIKRQEAAAEAAERTARVQQLAGQFARRLSQRDLIKGWQTWHEAWWLEHRRKRLLATAGGRLARPKLSACFSHWRADWQVRASYVHARACSCTCACVPASLVSSACPSSFCGEHTQSSPLFTVMDAHAV